MPSKFLVLVNQHCWRRNPGLGTLFPTRKYVYNSYYPPWNQNLTFVWTTAFAPLLLERKAAEIRKKMNAGSDSEKGEKKYKDVRTVFDGIGDRQYVPAPSFCAPTTILIWVHLQLESYTSKSTFPTFCALRARAYRTVARHLHGIYIRRFLSYVLSFKAISQVV